MYTLLYGNQTDSWRSVWKNSCVWYDTKIMAMDLRLEVFVDSVIQSSRSLAVGIECVEEGVNSMCRTILLTRYMTQIVAIMSGSAISHPATLPLSTVLTPSFNREGGIGWSKTSFTNYTWSFDQWSIIDQNEKPIVGVCGSKIDTPTHVHPTESHRPFNPKPLWCNECTCPPCQQLRPNTSPAVLV